MSNVTADQCLDSLCLSYLSCLSLKVDILPRGNLPLISMQVGWEELEREVGTCSYECLERRREFWEKVRQVSTVGEGGQPSQENYLPILALAVSINLGSSEKTAGKYL